MTTPMTHDPGCRALEFEGPDPLCRKCDSVTHDPQRLERARELLERCVEDLVFMLDFGDFSTERETLELLEEAESFLAEMEA